MNPNYFRKPKKKKKELCFNCYGKQPIKWGMYKQMKYSNFYIVKHHHKYIVEFMMKQDKPQGPMKRFLNWYHVSRYCSKEIKHNCFCDKRPITPHQLSTNTSDKEKEIISILKKIDVNRQHLIFKKVCELHSTDLDFELLKKKRKTERNTTTISNLIRQEFTSEMIDSLYEYVTGVQDSKNITPLMEWIYKA